MKRGVNKEKEKKRGKKIKDDIKREKVSEQGKIETERERGRER